MSWLPKGGADLPNQQLIGSTAKMPAGKIGENMHAHFVQFPCRRFSHHRNCLQEFPVGGASFCLARRVVLPGFPYRFPAGLMYQKSQVKYRG
jgi:hypothetical protein